MRASFKEYIQSDVVSEFPLGRPEDVFKYITNI